MKSKTVAPHYNKFLEMAGNLEQLEYQLRRVRAERDIALDDMLDHCIEHKMRHFLKLDTAAIRRETGGVDFYETFKP